jgi:hypothetical protein
MRAIPVRHLRLVGWMAAFGCMVVVAACQPAASSPLGGSRSFEPATFPGTDESPAFTTLPPTPTPAGSPSTPQPPSPSGSPPGSAIRPDSFAVVITDDLRVRTQPRVSDDSIRLEPLLWDGAVLFVIDGPVEGSGFQWFLVQPMSEVDIQIHPDPPQLGWVAAGSKDGEAWLAPWAVECLASPLGRLVYDLPDLPPSLADLACFGDQTLTFDADFGVPEIECGIESPWYVDPGWLDTCMGQQYLLAEPGNEEEDRVVWVTVDPGMDHAAIPPIGPGSWAELTVQGQYDHPAARTCRAEWTDSSSAAEPQPPELVVLGCRTQFVITGVEPRS